MHHRPDIEDETGQGGRSPRKPPHSRRLAKVALLGGFIALLTRSGVRGRVLDKLFGPEEEFEYESETDPEPLTDLSADPASATGDAEDHDEQELDEPAGDQPQDAAGASWQPTRAPDAVPLGPDDRPAPAEDAEPSSAPAQPSEPPFAAAGPRIFAVPSVLAADPRRDEDDASPASDDAVRPDAPASYVPTPPASYVQDAPVSDVPADDEPEAPQPPSAPRESPSERDRRYSWGGDARSAPVVEFLATPADEEPPGDGNRPVTGEATITELPRPAVEDRPLPGVDELAGVEPSRVAFAPPGDSPPPTSTPLVFSRDDEAEPDAPASPRELTEPGSHGPLSDSPVESFGRNAAEASDDGAPEAFASPLVIGEEPPDREPDAEPWRTAPSIVIENGDLTQDREPGGAVATPWSSSDTNGGGTPRAGAGSDAAEHQAGAMPISGTIASDDEAALSTADSWSTHSLVRDEPTEAAEPASTPVEPVVAESEPAVAAGEPTVASEPIVASEPTGADTAPPLGADEATVGITGPTASASEPATAPASAESPAATSESADGAVATVARGEPGIGEAAPRRSGWWLSRRRRGSVPEPPRWD